MSEQQYQGTLASGGTFVADGQGVRILDPAGNQLANFGRAVISGISRDGQIVTIERHNDTIVTLTTASITDAVGLEQHVRDTIVSPPAAAPPIIPPPPPDEPATEEPPLAFDAFDEDEPTDQPPAPPPPPPPADEADATRPPIISRPEDSEDAVGQRAPHDLPEPVPTRAAEPVAPLPPSQPPPASYQATTSTPAAPPPVDVQAEGESGGRRLWLWGCLGCGGLLILAIICVAVLFATEAIDPDDFTEDDATPTPFIIIATEPENEATPTEGDGGSVEPTATPNDGGSTEPTATSEDGGEAPTEPPAEGVMSAGETGSLGGMNVTYVSSRTDSNGLIAPSDGNEYLILSFRIENTTDEEVTVSSLLQFELDDEAGSDFVLAFGADIENGLDNDVAAGETLEGEIAFEVPEGGGPFTISYTEAFGTEALVWAV